MVAFYQALLKPGLTRLMTGAMLDDGAFRV